MGYIWTHFTILSFFGLLCYLLALFSDILEEKPTEKIFASIGAALEDKKNSLKAVLFGFVVLHFLLLLLGIKIRKSLEKYYNRALAGSELTHAHSERSHIRREIIEEPQIPDSEAPSVNSYNFIVRKSDEVFRVFGKEELRNMKELDNSVAGDLQTGINFLKKNTFTKKLSRQVSCKEKNSKFKEIEEIRKSYSPDPFQMGKQNKNSPSPDLENILILKPVAEMSDVSEVENWENESHKLSDKDRKARLEKIMDKKQLQRRKTPSEKRKCVICMENKIDCVFRPCGHGGVCLECAQKMVQEKAVCYCCREPIKRVVQIDNTTVYKDVFRVKDVYSVIEE